ncbi:GNAT family N-acetyltransferase [Bacillus sp. A301a_S52]|nr:GNAT family N-acetyltransferase [Bacillus sp. A301a_S52]
MQVLSLGNILNRGDVTLKLKEEKFEVVSETERLVIRPLQKADYENWLNEFENRYPSQYRHDQGKIDMSECTQEWFHNLVDKHQELALTDTAYIFGVFQKTDGTHLGMVDFSILAREDFQWGRIGYTIHNQYWRKGYGKEAVKEAINMAFKHLKFHRIEAHINLDNSASINLAESVGLEYECTRKRFIFEFGEWTDNLIYYKNSIE